jgi:DNA-binding NtrC family response regulator
LLRLMRLDGFGVACLQSAAAAHGALLAERFCVVVSDIRLPDANGGDLFLELAAQRADVPPFLFMTAYGATDRAVELLKAGTADYVTKPFDVDQLVQKVRALAESDDAGGKAGDTRLGVSAAMRSIAESLPRLAKHAATLLITGESGSGKERVARLFHQYAVGTSGEFVAVNCASSRKR